MTNRPDLRLVSFGPTAPSPTVVDVLRHRRVLVAGEDAFVLSYISSVLESAGARLLGPVTPAKAMLEPASIDGAVVALSASPAWVALADELAVAGVPFVLVSDYTPRITPVRHRDRPLIPRAFGAFQIVEALVALTAPN